MYVVVLCIFDLRVSGMQFDCMRLWDTIGKVPGVEIGLECSD